MPLYRRKWPCAICHKPVIWDSDKKEMSCGCKTERYTFVNLDAFEPLLKIDRPFWGDVVTLPIDSVKIVDKENKVMRISDRDSIFKGNEDPKIKVWWVKYPRKSKVQVCFAIQGRFHKEKICYNQKDPKEWENDVFIYLPREIIPKLIEVLQKDPHKIDSWM